MTHAGGKLAAGDVATGEVTVGVEAIPAVAISTRDVLYGGVRRGGELSSSGEVKMVSMESKSRGANDVDRTNAAGPHVRVLLSCCLG